MSQSQEMALFGDKAAELPAHLQGGTGAGNENVSSTDVAIPRLSLLQAISPQVETLDGAKAGLFHNSITDELYEKVYVMNLKYDKEFAVFKKRKLGGGFEGNYKTREEAVAYLEGESKTVADYDISETGRHVCLLLNEQGEAVQAILLLMSGTKMAVSNAWNSQIRLKGPDADRFASVWELTAVKQSNSSGTWFNFNVDFAGWASEGLYAEAKEMYEGMKDA